MDNVPMSQPKPWRTDPKTGLAIGFQPSDYVDDEAIEVDEESSSHGDSGEAPGTEWRDGHNRAWGEAKRVGWKRPAAAKRPRTLPTSPVSEEQDPELDAGVAATSTKIDLGLYFGTVPHAKQIAICRAYASYLSAKRRASSSEK